MVRVRSQRTAPIFSSPGTGGSGDRLSPVTLANIPNGYDSTKPDVFKAPLSVPGQYINETTTLPTFADAAYIFRHDDDGVTLPGSRSPLLRIRYRLHDSRGRLQGTDGLNNPTNGIWFEHIIRVNRP